MYIIIVLGLLVLAFGFNMFLQIRKFKARKNPIPEVVKDVYDEKTYLKWRSYSSELQKLDIIFSIIYFVINIVFFSTILLAFLTNKITNIHYSSLAVVGIYIGVTTIFDIINDYIKTMKIEEKYGFNKTKMHTFVGDILRNILAEVLLSGGIVSLFIALYTNIGDYILLLLSAILFIFLMFISFLYPFFARLKNKFKPLEEGELKTKLVMLLEKNGYRVKDIKVMDASRRTTKSNAYFAGFSKMKTIVLYDNMLNVMGEDEIVAVFAHEMGHGLHKDTLKQSCLSLVNIIMMVFLMWLLVKIPDLYQDFGFSGINYGFAFILFTQVLLPFESILYRLLSFYVSRKAEYRADEQAYIEGYGDNLINALKILNKENLSNLNPDPLVVVLSYSHPTLAQRINHINELKEKTKEE